MQASYINVEPSIDQDTFKLLILKRRRAVARILKGHSISEAEKHEGSHETVPCGALAASPGQVMKGKKQKKQVGRHRKTNTTVALDDEMVQEDQTPTAPKRSRAEVMAERNELASERETITATLSEQQSQMDELQDRLEQLNDKKHTLVIKLKQALKREVSLKRQASTAVPPGVPPDTTPAAPFSSSTPVSRTDISNPGTHVPFHKTEAAEGIQGSMRIGFPASSVPGRVETHGEGPEIRAQVWTSPHEEQQRDQQEPFQRPLSRGMHDVGALAAPPAPPRRPEWLADQRFVGSPSERQGLKRHHYDDQSEEGEVAPSPPGGPSPRIPVYFPREPPFPGPPPFDGGSSWREGPGMRDGSRPRMRSWEPSRGGRDNNDRPRDWGRGGMRGRGGWRGGGMR